LCHDTKTPGFLLPLRGREDDALRLALERPRLQRAIGVVYRPETERHSHYYHADLPRQFDEWIWIDETSAVTPLPARERDGVLETWPSGL
jgi:protein-L-isoaspartate(D-aspartate) O-methyltransferase